VPPSLLSRGDDPPQTPLILGGTVRPPKPPGPASPGPWEERPAARLGRQLPVLVLPGALCPFFMFGQLCVLLCVADGDGVAAVPADPLLAAVVPDADDEVVDDEVDAGADV
jgi:hypothetical protein